MDSRESQPTPPQMPPHPQHQRQHQSQANLILGPTSSYPTTTSTAAHHVMNMINPNIPPAAGAGFLFGSAGPSRQQSRPLSSDGVFDGSSPPSSSGMRFSMEPAKKKRGRPRKYTPDGNIALGLSPTPISPSANSIGHADSGGITPGMASEPPSKRNRGRPPGSGKKQLDALGGVGGVGFTPHVITVKAGEDIASKIVAFSQQGPRKVCILSANGAICNVTLRQPAMSGTVMYEGRFEIISLSGSFLPPENNGNRSRLGCLSVSLAGSDGRVLGGGVAGVLLAASPVQVIVGSFIADGRKSPSNSKSGPSLAPMPQILNFGAPLTTASPLSQGPSSESSDENGSSPLNRDPTIYNNASQRIHNMPVYQLWAGQNRH